MKIEFEMIVFTNIEYWQGDWEVNANAYGTVYLLYGVFTFMLVFEHPFLDRLHEFSNSLALKWRKSQSLSLY